MVLANLFAKAQHRTNRGNWRSPGGIATYSAVIRFVCNMSPLCMFQCYNIQTSSFLLTHYSFKYIFCWPHPRRVRRYHCQYGPNDNASHIPLVTKDMYQKKRKLDAKDKYVPNGKSHTGPRTSARMRGLWQRRGCQCGFVVKQLYLEPSVAETMYHRIKHMNLKGFFCHGATKAGHKSRFSNHLLLEVREFIMSHLRLGLSIPQIMAKHRKRFLEVSGRGEELTRDLFICDQDIHNVVGRLAIETYKRDNNDTKYVRMWGARTSPPHVLLQRVGRTCTTRRTVAGPTDNEQIYVDWCTAMTETTYFVTFVKTNSLLPIFLLICNPNTTNQQIRQIFHTNEC